MDDLFREMEEWLAAERDAGGLDEEARAAWERCQTELKDWRRVQQELHRRSNADMHAPVEVGILWVVVDSMNRYHLALHNFVALMFRRRRR